MVKRNILIQRICKDRAKTFIVQDALKKKLITKGGTIVEGTAGNTGIGLAIV